MTDPTPPDLSETDELVSAVLDGEATAAEVARVDADPRLRAQLERLRAQSDRIAVVDAPPPGLADAAIEAGLAHLAAASGQPVAPAVDQLSARRAAKARRLAPLLAAAAAVVVLALGVAAIQTLDSGSEDTASANLDSAGQAADAEPAAEEFGESGADASAGDEAPAEAPSADATDATAPNAEIIVAPDVSGFERAVRVDLDSADFEAGPPNTTIQDDVSAESALPPCDESDPASRRTGRELRFGSGTIGEQPVTYTVFDTADGPVLVIYDGVCGIIAEIAL